LKQLFKVTTERTDRQSRGQGGEMEIEWKGWTEDQRMEKQMRRRCIETLRIKERPGGKRSEIG